MKNLFESWGNLTHLWTGQKILLFLDYDGTLAPIAPIPSEAFLTLENKELLERLVQNPSYQVTIISGRSLLDLRQRVGIKGVIYIGNHGWEIDDSSMHFESLIPSQVSSAMKKIKYELITQLSEIKGALVEDKGPTLSVHYRQVESGKESLVRRIFDYICMPYRKQNMIRVQAGKKVLELRPPLAWDKGKAAFWLLRKQEILHGQGNVVPVYVGDDSTDEDAFEALKDLGVTILVGAPRRFSAAQYYIAGPQEVTGLLKYFADSLSLTP